VGGNLVFTDDDGDTVLEMNVEDKTLYTGYSLSGGPLKPKIPFTAAANLTAGDLIYISGWDATGDRPVMNKADADAANPAKCAEFVCDATVLKDALGFAVGEKLVSAVDTSSASAVGDPVYLSDTTAGGWALAAPASGGDVIQKVGVVTVKDDAAGAVMLYPFYSKTVTVNTIAA
jgi:hypothetical protein